VYVKNFQRFQFNFQTTASNPGTPRCARGKEFASTTSAGATPTSSKLATQRFCTDTLEGTARSVRTVRGKDAPSFFRVSSATCFKRTPIASRTVCSSMRLWKW
jgi:hypothetical protein